MRNINTPNIIDDDKEAALLRSEGLVIQNAPCEPKSAFSRKGTEVGSQRIGGGSQHMRRSSEDDARVERWIGDHDFG